MTNSSEEDTTQEESNRKGYRASRCIREFVGGIKIIGWQRTGIRLLISTKIKNSRGRSKISANTLYQSETKSRERINIRYFRELNHGRHLTSCCHLIIVKNINNPIRGQMKACHIPQQCLSLMCGRCMRSAVFPPH